MEGGGTFKSQKGEGLFKRAYKRLGKNNGEGQLNVHHRGLDKTMKEG